MSAIKEISFIRMVSAVDVNEVFGGQMVVNVIFAVSVISAVWISANRVILLFESEIRC